MRPSVYLDCNATMPVRPQVAVAVAEALAHPGNPSSVHRFGRLARRRTEDARERVAALVGAHPANVVFTSGGTEANNLAVRGCGRRRVLVSAVEHDSVLGAHAAPEIIPVDADGVVDLEALAALLGDEGDDTLVAVMLANNETGVIQPVAAVAELTRSRGALLHCDAVQAAGKIPVDLAALGADMLSLSAHKLGGAQGAGALVLADEALALAPLLRGGGQEKYRRAGTENVPGIVGFGVAAAIAADELGRTARLSLWRDRLERRAREIAPASTIFGAARARLPNTSCLTLPGVASDVQVMSLDLAGVAVSAGSACSSGKVAPSHVLRAMGATAEQAGSAIRVSLGWGSEEGDVDRFLDAWAALARRTGRAGSAAASAA